MRSRYLVVMLALVIPISGLIGGTLTVTKDGAGDGTIRVNGVGQTLPFSQSYPAGTSLTLEAVPTDSKSQFDWWSGYINSTDNPVTFSMPLFANASVAAAFSLSPPDIDTAFPWMTVGVAIVGSSCYHDISISNIGGQTLYVVSMSVTGANASEFFIANVNQSFSIAPDAGHTLTLGFTPAGIGGRSAILNIFSSDPDENPFQISLSGLGVLPDIASNPAGWDYSSVSIGGHADKMFTVRNDGTGVLDVSSSAITGSNSAEFTILSGGGSFQLDEGLSRGVTVRFSPTGAGGKSASLAFNSNDPDENPFHVSLSGTGIVDPGETSPDIASDPASWDFGTVSAGSYLDKAFVISNVGTANLNVTAVTLSGADATEFSIRSGGGPFTLAPAGVRNVVVRFTSSGSGVKNAVLNFASNDPDENPFLVHLSGGGGISILIDGSKDGFYNTLTGPENGFLNIPSPLYNWNGAPRDDSDLSAKVWTAWDDTYLYLYEEVIDDTVHATNVTDWQNDCLELRIDPDPSKMPDTGVKWVTLTALDSAGAEPSFYAGITNLPDKSDYARRRTADGYILELRVKWAGMTVPGRGPVVPAVGNVFGLAINQTDNDRSVRQASIQWAAKLDDAVWSNPRLHGMVTFQDGHKLRLEARNAIVDTLVNPLSPLYVPNDLPWPMLTMDVGSVQTEGNASYDASGGVYTVSGSGVDIWDNSDGFRFVFRQLSGNVEMTARISSLTESDPWTKGGLMIRDGLTAGSKNAMMAVASDNGLTFQNRPVENGGSFFTAGNTSIKPPYWLRIVRAGNTLIGLASADGASWTEVGRKVMAMTDPVYAGMAVTAHRDGFLSTGTFSDVTFRFTGVTGVKENAASGMTPRMCGLSQNYPNPFNSSTVIRYLLPEQAAVELSVYDLSGRRVRTLVRRIEPTGSHEAEWDGTDDRGGRSASGLYLCRLRFGGTVQTAKMMLLD